MGRETLLTGQEHPTGQVLPGAGRKSHAHRELAVLPAGVMAETAWEVGVWGCVGAASQQARGLWPGDNARSGL